MSLTQDQAVELIKRLEIEASQSPRGYQTRVILLGLLGYAYIFAILTLLAIILYWLVIIAKFFSGSGAGYAIGKIGWLVLGFAVIIVRALWVQIPHPTGIALNERESPRLFQLIAELTVKMRAPRIHQVLLTNEFNAAVVQIPRRSFFGWPKNYLLLGLPLMAGLATGHFSAVVAHELGHISGHHGRILAWIYRIRVSWYQLLTRLQADQHMGSFVFKKFFHWYAPYFNAYSFVLARAHELDADRRAAAITTEKTATEGLIAVNIKARELGENYWPSIYQQANHLPEPSISPYLKLVSDRADGAARDDSFRWLSDALAVDTGYADTHPCLRERLSALGVEKTAVSESLADLLRPNRADKTSAANQLLGDTQFAYAKLLDNEWREAVSVSWKDRFQEFKEAGTRMEQLSAQARIAALPPELAWEQISLTAKVNGPETAIPLAQDLLRKAPDYVPANYLLGQILAEQGNAEGVTHLKRAMTDDADFIIPACAVLYTYYTRMGDKVEAQKHLNRFEEQRGILALAQQERQSVTRDDQFLSHGLSPDEVRRLTKQLRRYSRVRRAFLVRKSVIQFPGKPFYVLSIEPRFSWLEVGTQKNNQELVNQLIKGLKLPGETYICVFGQGRHWLKRTLRRVKGAQIYYK